MEKYLIPADYDDRRIFFMKKDSEISRMFQYAGNRHWLTVLGMILAGLSTVLSMVPFVCIWFVVRDMLNALTAGDIRFAAHSSVYAWWAAGFSILSILLYFIALCCSHLAAFRTATNMKKAAMHHIVKLPLGYFSQNASGRLRKVIDDNAGLTENFLAHQLPDLTGAVEYIRGIPVVKVFQQTVYSFKNFHAAIEEYEKYASGYALKCRIPLTGFNVALNGTFILLIPVACMILAGVSGQASYQDVLLDFLFYSLFTPICTTMMNRVMFAGEQLMAAKSAVTRIEEVLKEQSLPETANSQQPKDASIAFKDVSFCYPGTETKALEHISFEVPQGKTVALVGASGSGKSTAAKLIPCFYDVTEGSVLVVYARTPAF